MNNDKITSQMQKVKSVSGEKILITLKEAAARLSISVRSYTRYAQTGELPLPIKIGRSVRINLQDLERCIAQKVTV